MWSDKMAWIKTSDKLPEFNGRLLTIARNGHIEISLTEYVIKYSDEYLYWMPLPEPPK